MRFIFILKALWQQWGILKQYRTDLSLQTKTIFQCSLPILKQSGIKILVLDYDNVLAGHAVDVVEDKVRDFLKQSVEIFGTGCVYILSNRPTPIRQTYFKENFQGIEFIFGFRKKPYPDSLLWIIKETKVTPQAVLVVEMGES